MQTKTELLKEIKSKVSKLDLQVLVYIFKTNVYIREPVLVKGELIKVIKLNYSLCTLVRLKLINSRKLSEVVAPDKPDMNFLVTELGKELLYFMSLATPEPTKVTKNTGTQELFSTQYLTKPIEKAKS
jgi:hypothetical protein